MNDLTESLLPPYAVGNKLISILQMWKLKFREANCPRSPLFSRRARISRPVCLILEFMLLTTRVTASHGGSWTLICSKTSMQAYYIPDHYLLPTHIQAPRHHLSPQFLFILQNVEFQVPLSPWPPLSTSLIWKSYFLPQQRRWVFPFIGPSTLYSYKWLTCLSLLHSFIRQVLGLT